MNARLKFLYPFFASLCSLSERCGCNHTQRSGHRSASASFQESEALLFGAEFAGNIQEVHATPCDTFPPC